MSSTVSSSALVCPHLPLHATREQLQARMRNQISAEEKMMRAHYVVLNYEGNPRARQVLYIHKQLIAIETSSNIKIT